jgi:alpha-D-xyloside xylohydrolase
MRGKARATVSGGRWRWACAASALLAGVAPLALSADPIATVDRNGALVSVEPYAPGIVRVTIATDRAEAEGNPGYGRPCRSASQGQTASR